MKTLSGPKSMGALLVLIFLLTAAFVSATGQTESDEAVELTVWDFKYGEIDGAGPIMEELDDRFLAANPGVTLNHVAQPNDQYNNIIRTAVAARSGPDVVMSNGGGAWLRDFADSIYTLDEVMGPYLDEWSDSVLMQGSVDGELKTVPLTGQGFGFYYNKALFEQAGLDPDDPPTDWDSFVEASEALQAAGITPMLYPNANMDPSRFTLWTLLTNFFPTDESLEAWRTGQASFQDDPGYKTALSYMATMRERGYLDPNGASVPYFMEGIEQFQRGEGAMMIGLLSDIAHWKQFSDALGADNVGYFPTIDFPESGTGGRQIFSFGIGWAITDFSEAKDAGVDYILSYVRGDGAAYFGRELGALVPNSAVDLNAFAESYPVFGVISAALNAGSVNHYFGYLPGGMRNETIVNYDVLFNAGSITVDEVVDNLERAYRSLLAEQE